MAASSGGGACIEWLQILRRLYVAETITYSKSDLVDLCCVIRKSESEFLRDKEDSSNPPKKSLVFLSAHYISQCAKKFDINHIGCVHGACQVLFKYLLSVLQGSTNLDCEQLRLHLCVISALCTGSTDLPEIDVEALTQSMKGDTVTDSAVKQDSKPRSDLSADIFDQLTLPITDVSSRPSDPADLGITGDPISSLTRLFSQSNAERLHSLRGGDTFIDMCLLLPSIRRSRYKVEDALAGKPFTVPTNLNEANLVLSSVVTALNDIKIASSAFKLPILEPLTASKLDKLYSFSMSLLQCAVTHAVANSIFQAGLPLNKHYTHVVLGTKEVNTSGVQVNEELEVEVAAVQLVDHALNLFDHVGRVIRQSNRAGGHTYLNHLLAGAWILLSNLNTYLAPHISMLSSSDIQQFAKAAAAFQTSSNFVPSSDKSGDKCRSASKIAGTPTQSGTPTSSTTSSPTVNRGGFYKLQQIFGGSIVVVISKLLTMLDELFEDVYIEWCGGSGNVVQVEPAPLSITGQFNALQRIARILSITPLNQFLFYSAIITYKKGSMLKRQYNSKLLPNVVVSKVTTANDTIKVKTTPEEGSFRNNVPEDMDLCSNESTFSSAGPSTQPVNVIEAENNKPLQQLEDLQFVVVPDSEDENIDEDDGDARDHWMHEDDQEVEHDEEDELDDEEDDEIDVNVDGADVDDEEDSDDDDEDDDGDEDDEDEDEEFIEATLDDDSEQILGPWFEDTNRPAGSSNVNTVTDGANISSTTEPQIHMLDPTHTTITTQSTETVKVAPIVVNESEAHSYLQLSANIFAFMNKHLVSSKSAYVARYVKNGLNEQQVVILAVIIKDLDQETFRDEAGFSFYNNFSKALTHYTHNMITNPALQTLQASLLYHLSVSPWCMDVPHSWPLQVYSRTLAVLAQVVSLRSQHEREASVISIWHRLVNTLVDSVLRAPNTEVVCEDLNVEHAQVLLYLFHGLNLMQKKSVLLLLAGGILRCSEIATNQTEWPKEIQILHLSRLLLLFDYIMKHLYDAPPALLEQIHWNLFKSISPMDNSNASITSEQNSESTGNSEFNCARKYTVWPHLEENYRKQLKNYIVTADKNSLVVNEAFSPRFYMLTNVEISNQDTPKLDGLACNFILGTPDKLRYPFLLDALIDILNIMSFIRSSACNTHKDQRNKSCFPLFICSIQYCFTLCWKLLQLLPPSIVYVEKLASGEGMPPTSILLHSLVWTPRTSHKTFHKWLKDCIVKQGLYTQHADKLMKSAAEVGNTNSLKYDISNARSCLMGILKDVNDGKELKIHDKSSYLCNTDYATPSMWQLILLDAVLAKVEANLAENQGNDLGCETFVQEVFPLMLKMIYWLTNCAKMLLIQEYKEHHDHSKADDVIALDDIIAISSPLNPIVSNVISIEFRTLLPNSIASTIKTWNAKVLEHVSIDSFSNDIIKSEGYILKSIERHLDTLSSYTPPFNYNISLKHVIQTIIKFICEHAAQIDNTDTKNKAIETLISFSLDFRFDYLDDIVSKTISKMIGGEDTDEHQKRVYMNILEHSYNLMMQCTSSNLKGDTATTSYETILLNCLKFYEKILEKSAGRQALEQFFAYSDDKRLVKLLMSISSSNVSQKYSTQVLTFFNKLFQAAEKSATDPTLNALCCSISKLENIDTQVMSTWLYNIILGPEGSNIRQDQKSVNVELIKENCHLLYSLMTFILKQTDGMNEESASNMLKLIIVFSTHVLSFDAIKGAGFTDLISIMTMLADFGSGKGHIELFPAAVKWTIEFKKIIENSKTNDSSSLDSSQGRSNLESSENFEIGCCIMDYIADVLISLKAKCISSFHNTMLRKNQRSTSPPWEYDMSVDTDPELQDHPCGSTSTYDCIPEEDCADGDDSDEDSLCNKLCTFTISQKEFMNQHWYHCYTCRMLDGVGVCTICAKVCHRGHDLSYAKYGNFFCDCGAKGDKSCQALVKRSSNSVRERSHRSTDTKLKSKYLIDSFSQRLQATTPRGKYVRKHLPATNMGNGTKNIDSSSDWLCNYLITNDKDQNVIFILIELLKQLTPFVEKTCSYNSPIGAYLRAQEALIQLHSKRKPLCYSSDLVLPSVGSQEGAFENIRLSYTGEQGQTIRQLLSAHIIRRVAMCCMSSPIAIGTGYSKRQTLAVCHEKGKITLLQLSTLFKQNDSQTKKLGLTRLSSAPIPFTVLSMASNVCNEDYLAVCGLKDCHILTITSMGNVAEHLVLHPHLEAGNFIIKALWLPGSQTELALITADFVKVYNLAEDAISPIYYFLVPIGKIRDCTFMYDNERNLYHILIMSSPGHIYTELLNEDSSAKRGTFFVTNTLEVFHLDITDVSGQVAGGGVSIYYSHTLQLLFYSYAQGKSFISPLTPKETCLTMVFPITLPLHSVSSNATPTSTACAVTTTTSSVPSPVTTVAQTTVSASSNVPRTTTAAGASTTKTASSNGNQQPLCQWLELPNHPGLICCSTQSSNTPVVIMLKPDVIQVQELRAVPSKPKIMDMVLVRNQNGTDAKTALILLCEDGSLKLFMANMRQTGYWMSPHIQPVVQSHSSIAPGFNTSHSPVGVTPVVNTSHPLRIKKTRQKPGTISKSVQSNANVTFPVDFFESCSEIDVEFGGKDLLQLYNVLQLKNRLSTNGLYVASNKSTGFCLEFGNYDPNMVIVGIRILVGSQNIQRAPSYVDILGRVINLSVWTSRWFDIPFTREESIQFDRTVTITFGPSVDPESVTMLDSVKVYGKHKEVFGWPDETQEHEAATATANNHIQKIAQKITNLTNSLTCFMSADVLETPSSKLEKMLVGILESLECTISVQKLGGQNAESIKFDSLKDVILNVVTQMLILPTSRNIQCHSKGLLASLYASKHQYYAYKDNAMLRYVMDTLDNMTNCLQKSEELSKDTNEKSDKVIDFVNPKLSHIDAELFYRLILIVRSIAISRPHNLAKFANSLNCVPSTVLSHPSEVLNTVAGLSTNKTHLLLKLLEILWILQLRNPMSVALTSVVVPGLKHTENIILALVDIAHAFDSCDTCSNATITVYIQLLLCDDQVIAFTAKQALVKVLRSRALKKRKSIALPQLHPTTAGVTKNLSTADTSTASHSRLQDLSRAMRLRTFRVDPANSSVVNPLEMLLGAAVAANNSNESNENRESDSRNQAAAAVAAARAVATAASSRHVELDIPELVDLPDDADDDTMVELAIALSLQDHENVGDDSANEPNENPRAANDLDNILNSSFVVYGEDDDEEDNVEVEVDVEAGTADENYTDDIDNEVVNVLIGNNSPHADETRTGDDDDDDRIDEDEEEEDEVDDEEIDDDVEEDDDDEIRDELLALDESNRMSLTPVPPPDLETNSNEHNLTSSLSATEASTPVTDQETHILRQTVTPSEFENLDQENCSGLHNLRLQLLERFTEFIPNLKQLNGIRAIPFMQIILHLVSDIDGDNERDRTCFNALLKAIMLELDFNSTELADIGKELSTRNPTNEVKLVFMRFLSVLMSKCKNTSSPCSFTKSQTPNLTADNSAYLSKTTAVHLNKINIIKHCNFMLKALLTYWKGFSNDLTSESSSNNSTGFNLLRKQLSNQPPDMTPFFLKQFVKEHANDVFETYPQLLTEMALRLPYQVHKYTESADQSAEEGAKTFDNSWFSYLCEYMMTSQTPFVRRQVRKLLLFICGSKEKYRQLRDVHAITSHMQAITDCCIKGGYQTEQSEINQQSITLSYNELVGLVENIKACQDIAVNRTANWQRYCVRNANNIPFLIRLSCLVDEIVSPSILHLVQCAIVSGRQKMQPLVQTAITTAAPRNANDKPIPRPQTPIADDNSTFEEELSVDLVEVITSNISTETMARFIKLFLIETNISSVRWQVHSLIASIHKKSNSAYQEILIKLLWKLWPQVCQYGRRVTQFIDLLGYFTLKYFQSPNPSNIESRVPANAHYQHIVEYVDKALQILRQQNDMLARHPNSSLYLGISHYLEFENFYLESDPCLVCNNPEMMSASIKLNSVKVDTKFTTTMQIVKLISSHIISRISLRIGDVRRTKMIRTINIYYNNRNVQAVVELKNKPALWHKAKRVVIQSGQTEVKIDFPLPIIACNLMFEYVDFYENIQASSETLQCPRCSAAVPANPGVCGNCGENVFQCHKCRAINYDEKDPFLCHACGFCKYAKFEFTINAKSCCAVEPIENDDDRKKTITNINALLEKADRIYKQLAGYKVSLENLLLRLSENSGIGAHRRLFEEQSLVSNLTNNSVRQHTTTTSTTNTNPSHAHTNVSNATVTPITTAALAAAAPSTTGAHTTGTTAATTTTTAAATSALTGSGTGSGAVLSQIQAAAAANATASITKISRQIRILAQHYCQDCKVAYEELSRIIQKVLVSRKELIAYDRRHQDSSDEFRIELPSFVNADVAHYAEVQTPKCYGCSIAAVEHCLVLLRAMASFPIARQLLVRKGLINDLVAFNVRKNSTYMAEEIEQLLCILTKDNISATEQLCNSLTDRINAILSGYFIMTKANIFSPTDHNLDLGSRVKYELSILSAILQKDDECWELKVRCLSKIFLNACNESNNPLVMESVILPCLKMFHIIMRAPQPLLERKPPGTNILPAIRKQMERNKHAQQNANKRTNAMPPVELAQFIHASPGHSFADWRLKLAAQRGKRDRVIVKPTKEEIHIYYLMEKYFERWLRRIRKSLLNDGSESFSNMSWIKPVMFNSTARVARTVLCNIIKMLWANSHPARKKEIVLMLTSFLTELSTARENASEFLSLYQLLIQEQPWKQFLTLRGVLITLANLINAEIEQLHRLESTRLTSDLTQGYALNELTELLSSFLDDIAIQRQYKNRLVGTVLNGYLSLRRLVVQRTRFVDYTQEKLLELLEDMTSGTEEESKAFMRICIDTVKKFSMADILTPVFIFERLCTIIYPDENDLSDFFVTLEKDPQQEDFLQGRMLGNPYSCLDVGMGPLMRNIKNKICQDCELVALLDDDNGMELLVNNKIISLDLKVREVYKKIWLAEGGDHGGMRILYRMRGLLGDATEEFIETLSNKSQIMIDNEQVYKMANVLADDNCEGLHVMLNRLAFVTSANSDTNKKASVNIWKAKPLLQVLLKLFQLAVKVERCQRVLIQPTFNAMEVFLRTLKLCLDTDTKKSRSNAASNAISVTTNATSTSNASTIGGVTTSCDSTETVTDQLLDIMETILTKAANDTFENFEKFSQTFGGSEYITSLLGYVATNNALSRRLVKVLAGLVYGRNETAIHKMSLLMDHFRPVIDLNQFDKVHTTDKQQKLEMLCTLANEIQRNSIGNTLKDYIVDMGVLDECLKYILQHAPPHCVKPSLLRTDTDELKDFLTKPALKYCLRLLTGLAYNHEQTQTRIASDVPPNDNIIPIIHRLEQVSTDEHVGSLAENLLEALCTNSLVANRIEEVRELTRAEKKRLAMAMREKQLGQLGMRTNEKGQVVVAAKTASSIAGHQIDELSEETGLVCCICREGYKYQPSKVLAIYTFTKRCNVDDYEIIRQSGSGLGGAGANHTQGASTGVSNAATTSSSTSGPPVRRTTGYTTVTHFNVVHVDCHMNAVRLARVRDEWESAALQNANTKCNGLLPLWGPQVAESAFASCLARHNTYLQECTNHRDIGHSSTVHDLKLLLLKFAFERSFHEDSGGGGPQSNMLLVPYLMHVALYVINSTRVYQNEVSALTSYLRCTNHDYWIENSFEAEGPLYWATMSLLVHATNQWKQYRVDHLKRLIVLAISRYAYPSGVTTVASTNFQLTHNATTDYSIYKPYLIFFALISGIYTITLKHVSGTGDQWPTSVADYIKHNDEALTKSADALLAFYTDELIPCQSFAEFCDVADLLDVIVNPDCFISDLILKELKES